MADCMLITMPDDCILVFCIVWFIVRNGLTTDWVCVLIGLLMLSIFFIHISRDVGSNLSTIDIFVK
ncbi:hypothetical protein ACJX0J_039934, partial [Zea mays]